jgi:hypothetical protein
MVRESVPRAGGVGQAVAGAGGVRQAVGEMVVGERLDVLVLGHGGVVEAGLPELGGVAGDWGVVSVGGVGVRHASQERLLVHHRGGDNLR